METFWFICYYRKVNNQYNFSGNVISIYAMQPFKPVVYKIDANYYLQINKAVYLITKTNSNKPLTVVKTVKILEQISRIDFENEK